MYFYLFTYFTIISKYEQRQIKKVGFLEKVRLYSLAMTEENDSINKKSVPG